MVDLCAAPGGWSEVCSAAAPSAVIVAVDLAAMSPLPNVHCVQGDLTHPDTVRSILRLVEPVNSAGADVVLCDCAPDVIHQADVDCMLQHDLVRAAIGVAERTLRTGGSFVCKVFRGAALPPLIRLCQRHFHTVQLAKPTASRNSSLEAFIVARMFAPHTSERKGDRGSETSEYAADSECDSDGDDESVWQQSIEFVSCGDELGLDSDQTYPLSFRIPNTQYTAYQPLAPAAAPIEPPYKESIIRQRDKAANSSHVQCNQ